MAADPRLMKALAHPLRGRALASVSERVASPGQIAAALGAPAGIVAYHVRVLAELDCVEPVVTPRPEDATERFYRVTDLGRQGLGLG